MKRFEVLPVNSPIVEIECGEKKKKNSATQNINKSPNFPGTVLSMTVVIYDTDTYVHVYEAI